jgi:hypothetical protein
MLFEGGVAAKVAAVRVLVEDRAGNRLNQLFEEQQLRRQFGRSLGNPLFEGAVAIKQRRFGHLATADVFEDPDATLIG